MRPSTCTWTRYRYETLEEMLTSCCGRCHVQVGCHLAAVERELGERQRRLWDARNGALTRCGTIRKLSGSPPPRSEQRRDNSSGVERSSGKESVDARRAIDLAQGELSLLREYRTRLIADVVTGKFDVREAAARLPDEVEELGAARRGGCLDRRRGRAHRRPRHRHPR